MGCNASIENLDIALTPQKTPLVAIDERFCSKIETTKLLFRGHIAHNDMKVFDRKTNKQIFFVYEPLLSVGNPKAIYDENNEPLVKMDRELGYENFYATDAKTGKDLFKIDTGIGLLYVDMNVRFKDPKTGEKYRLSVSGSWAPRRVVVWMIRESNLTPMPVARIASLGHGYEVEVASGVDVLLMVLMCAALDGALDASRTHILSTVLQRNEAEVTSQFTTKRLQQSVAHTEERMGGNTSKPNLNVELVPQTASPLVAVNVRFCLPETSTFRFQGHSGHNNFKVVDVDTHKQQFQVSEHSFSAHDRKTVYDKDNLPLVTLRESGHGNFYVADASTKKDLLKIESHSDILFINIAVRVTNPDTGGKFKLEVTGNWNQRKVLVWLTRGPNERVPVGRITKYGTYYDVEVAPGVDVALVVLLVTVLHDGTT